MYLNLNHINIADLQQHLSKHPTVVACLCAAWCDSCGAYLTKFKELAQQYPLFLFLWIDIEDQADLIGDFEVENFPTLLIQQHDVVTFFGTMQPETSQLKRIIESQATHSLEQLHHQIQSNTQSRMWQSKANLRKRLLGFGPL